MAKKTKPIGRPTLFTPETISKLEQVFAMGGTDLEACSYADVSKSALYNYQEVHPDFVERKEMLKERPFIKARQTIMKSLDNPHDAQWFLERKKKNEFAQRSELTGKDGGAIEIDTTTKQNADDLIKTYLTNTGTTE